MLSLTIRILFREMLELFQRAQDSFMALGAERRSARRLDRLSLRLTGMGAKIEQVRTLLGAGHAPGRFDADGSLRAALKGLKEEIREIRCQLAQLRRPSMSQRLQRAFNQLSVIAETTYKAADQLQWEINAHDSAWAC